ncbi:hypothetical protein FGB62_38g214 [Gracilaria domingensis]|nr:hypothetical protein FGB62_38g214 [Gracilaria domingensis]
MDLRICMAGNHPIVEKSAGNMSVPLFLGYKTVQIRSAYLSSNTPRTVEEKNLLIDSTVSLAKARLVMDSTAGHGPPLYDSIPLSSPRQAPQFRHIVHEHEHRVSLSSSVSLVLKALPVVILISASFLIVSRRHVSYNLLRQDSHFFNRTPNQLPIVHPSAPTETPYFRSEIAYLPWSSHPDPTKVVNHLSQSSLPHWNGKDVVPDVEDFFVQEYVGTGDCAGGKFCRARLTVSKKGHEVIIQAGYIISAVGGVDRDMDSLTRSLVSAVTTDETLRWADTLLGRVHDRLVEVNCFTTLEDVAAAIYFTSEIAATCPRTDDPRCHELLTIQQCTSLVPTPSPVPKDSCEVAFDECEFTFAGKRGLASFSIDGASDKSFTPVIVAKDSDVHLGVLNSNNVVPEFIEDSGVFPITKFGSPRFASSQFKPLSIWQGRGTGIGHQTFQGDQQQLARDRCIRIFFTSIQLMNPFSNLNNVPRSAKKCVVFRTRQVFLMA